MPYTDRESVRTVPAGIQRPNALGFRDLGDGVTGFVGGDIGTLNIRNQGASTVRVNGKIRAREVRG